MHNDQQFSKNFKIMSKLVDIHPTKLLSTFIDSKSISLSKGQIGLP